MTGEGPELNLLSELVASAGAAVEFRILGPIEFLNEGTARDLGGPRHRSLLAMLLLHAGEVVPSERLIEALWGEDPPRSAAAMLHVRVSELRRTLGTRRELLRTRRPGYLLQVSAGELDASRFEELTAEGRRALAAGDPRVAAERLRAALALWRGPALAEVADQPFARAPAARLEELRLQALEVRLDADLALGRHTELTAELEALVAENPLRERFHAQLMLALYRASRQGEALRTYRTARERLVEELGVEPGEELRRLEAAVLRQDPALTPDIPRADDEPQAPPGNLPVRLTSFIGRERELAELHVLLDSARLVTLTGVGGVGKSRVALEAAAARTAVHPDGTWLVELASVTAPELVSSTVATTLGVREHSERPLAELLVEHLRTAEALLVLDNCEHLLEPVAVLVGRLLGACSRLQVLVTSRERLGIDGEAVRPVAGLALPEPVADSAAAIGQADAVRLFVERATSVAPSFRLSDATAAAVAQICQRLDGLPLAIELAATRASALGAEHIASRLDDRFSLLTGGNRAALPRHQTLRAVVDWSYELLSEPERHLFERLAVFVGSFTLDAAEGVCAPDQAGPVVSELLAHLVDKSLVTAEQGAAPSYRYRLLETLRAYGLERLGQRGETKRLRARHAAWFLALAVKAGDGLRGPQQAAWHDRLEADHGNLRAALEWSLETGDAETAMRLVGSLYQFWDLRGYYKEGCRWLDAVLRMDGLVRPATRVRAMLAAVTLAVIVGEVEKAAALCEQAAALSEAAGDTEGLAHALQYLGFMAIYAEELERSEALLGQSLELARTAGAGWVEGWSLLFLGAVALARGLPDLATERADAADAILLRVGDQEGPAWTLAIRAAASWRRGELLDSRESVRAAIKAFHALGGLWGLSLCLIVASQIAWSNGQTGRTATLLGAAEGLRESVGAALMPFVGAWLGEAVAAAAAALGDGAFGRAWRVGQELGVDAAVDEAMQGLDAAGPLDRDGPARAGLHGH
jgi:predicted ATPase/DNA-binding SARP family transcriptional activator